MTKGTEIPTSAQVTEIEMRAEDAVATVQRHGTILHVYVIDAVDEVLQEQVRRYSLPLKVARVEVQAKFRTILEFLQQAFGGIVVEGYLGRMNLEAIFDSILAEDIQNGTPQVINLLESAFYHLFGGLREGIHVLPDGRPHKPGHAIGTQLAGSNGRCLHRLDSPSPYAIGVVGQLGRGKVVKARVVIVTHALARHMGTQRFYYEAVLLEDGLDFLHISIILDRTYWVQVIAPNGKFDAVVPHLGSLAAQGVQVHVCPLTAHQGY